VTNWARASQLWDFVGPPLRPHPTEIKLFREALPPAEELQCALLFGVTPELYALPWPGHTELFAIDTARVMIETVWPGSRDAIVRGDWMALPFSRGSMDVLLIDNGLALHSYPDGQASLAASMRRVIRPGGVCIMRLLAQPEKRESVEDVVADIDQIPDLNALKFRLWMALQETAARGVRRHDVWKAIHDAARGDLAALAERTGWPTTHVLSVDYHRDVQLTYHFSGVDQVRELFADGFEIERVQYADHMFGHACPVVSLRRV
jgi:SAM-dependent methyltransferase